MALRLILLSASSPMRLMHAWHLVCWPLRLLYWLLMTEVCLIACVCMPLGKAQLGLRNGGSEP